MSGLCEGVRKNSSVDRACRAGYFIPAVFEHCLVEAMYDQHSLVWRSGVASNSVWIKCDLFSTVPYYTRGNSVVDLERLLGSSRRLARQYSN